MDWITVASIAGSISGVVALIALIFTKAYRLGAMATQLDTLWKIFVEGSLQSLIEDGLMNRGSYIITEKGEMILNELKEDIEKIANSKEFRKIAGNESIENISSFVANKLRVERLASVANTQHIALQKVVALAGVYAMKSFRL